jgi:hypothetical protein
MGMGVVFLAGRRSRVATGAAALGALLMAGCNLGVNPVTYELAGAGGVPLGPTGMASADIDADGDTDVVATGTNGYAVLTNDGTGAFTVVTPDQAAASTSAPSLADVDGDTDADLVALVAGVPTVRRNDGDGGFGAVEAVDPVPTGRLSALRVADVDGDDDLDLVTALQVGNARNVAVFAGDGTGAFGPAATYPLNHSFTSPTVGGLELGDLDGDDDPDLVLSDLRSLPTGAWRTVVLVAHNDGAGAFTVAGGAVEVGPTGLLDAVEPALTDVDEDGILDLAFGGGSAVTTLLGDGVGGFGAPSASPVPETMALEYVTPTDIDEDGNVDFVAYDNLFSSENGVVVYGDGDGGVADSHIVQTGTVLGGGSRGNDIEILDLEGDGDADILFLAGNLGVVENNTNGKRPVH